MPIVPSFLYYFVRPLARIAIWMYFKRIYLSNLQRIPKGKPVILASNHPTGFVEPCVMAVFMWRPLSFLVRGDFFRKPVYRFLLRSLNMVPIYRKRNASFQELKENQATFNACFDALKQKRLLMIFPEGSARFEKRLRPIHKGISRIAFGTLEKYPDLEDIYVVPLGVNFTYSDIPRQETMINVGRPISTRELFDRNKEDINQFDREFRAVIYERMLQGIVHVETGDEELVEYFQVLQRSDLPEEPPALLPSSTALLDSDKQVADTVAQLSDAEKETMTADCKVYFEKLKQLDIPDWVVARKNKKPSILTSIILVLTALPVAIGYVFAWGPSRIAVKIKEERVGRREFYSPVLIATHLGLFIIYYFIWILISLIAWNGWIFAGAVVLGLLAYGSLLWREARARQLELRRFQRLSQEQKEHLIAQRAALKERMTKLEWTAMPVL